MARVKMEEIVDHLSTEIRRALSETVESSIPGVQFDEYELFREFRRAIRRKCSTWEQVPDHYVDAD